MIKNIKTYNPYGRYVDYDDDNYLIINEASLIDYN